MNEKSYQNKEWLEEKYWEEGLTLSEIGDTVGKTKGTIWYYMKKHRIKRRHEKPNMVKCDTCGKEFKRRPSHVLEHTFCSKECFIEWIEKRETSNRKI